MPRSRPQRAKGAVDSGSQRGVVTNSAVAVNGGSDGQGARQSQRGGGESDSRSFHAAPRGLNLRGGGTARSDGAAETETHELEREYMPGL